jgi:hypothetical protein
MMVDPFPTQFRLYRSRFRREVFRFAGRFEARRRGRRPSETGRISFQLSACDDISTLLGHTRATPTTPLLLLAVLTAARLSAGECRQ